MTEGIDSEGANSYAVAFHIGAVGTIILCLSTLVAPLLAVLSALVVWTFVTLFVLPWLVECVRRRAIELPAWCYAFRGPHE